MHTEFTGYIDLAQVVLYAFWIFFGALIFYLRREDKREGYPLLYEGERGRPAGIGFPALAGPKSYLLHDGRTITTPNPGKDRRDAPVTPMAPWPGAPYLPTGNPMIDGVGPASYAQREDVPEMTINNVPTIVPLRVDSTITIQSRDPDPRGFPVYGADGQVGGVVTDVWVDRAEMLVRYLEVEVAGATDRRVLLPMMMAQINKSRGWVNVEAVLGSHFADAPTLANPNQVTRFEEDRITGYFGGGNLYATPARQEPLL